MNGDSAIQEVGAGKHGAIHEVGEHEACHSVMCVWCQKSEAMRFCQVEDIKFLMCDL